MEEKYFVELNGYFVKDKEAYKILHDKVNFLFPKFNENEYSGDSNLIKYGDKNILIDTNSNSNWDSVKDLLDDNNTPHIDYLIISHYDTDHIGNIENLINNNYIDSDTQVFLPIVPDNFLSVQTIETTIKTSLTNANISFRTPTEKEEITIGENLKITFGNLDKDYMESNYTEYNATSMVCLIEHKNIKAFYSGDAYSQTFKYLYNTNFITNTIDLYKQAHHGIDTNNPYIILDKIMTPTYTVQSGGINDFVKNNFFSAETSFLISEGTLYYPTYIQTDYINFESNGKSLNCLSGKTSSYSGQRNLIDLYVDINASVNNIQDGTEQNPFSELMQAIGYIKNFPSGTYTIHLADGDYGYSHDGGVTHAKNNIRIEPNNNLIISIVGNSNDNEAVTIHNMYISNAYVKLQNLTVDLKDADGIILDNSFMYANNIIINSKDNTQTTHTGILVEYGSRLRLTNSTIENCNKCVRVTTGSYYSYDNVTYDNYTQKAVDIVDSGACVKNIFDNQNGDIITLTDDYKKYDWIDVAYRSTSAIRDSFRIYAPGDGYRNCTTNPYIADSGETYEVRARFTLSTDTNGSKITISNKKQYTIGAGSNQSITITDYTGTFTVYGVYGGYNG